MPKNDPYHDYWKECISIAADECDLVLSEKQLSYLVDSVKGGHECYDMAFGYDVANENVMAMHDRDLEDTKKELLREQRKITCRDCGGSGIIVSNGPYHSSRSSCDKCGGKGRHDP